MIIHIIPFQKEYLKEVENLLREHPEIFSEKDLSKFKEDLQAYLEEPRHAADKGLAFVLIVDNLLCGFIIYSKNLYAHNTYNVKWLVVNKNEQGKGYGTHLVHEAIKKIKEIGGKHVYLETSNERHNDHTKKFYEGLGFQKVGVLPDYYDPPIKFPRKLEDGIIYHKPL